MRDVDEDLELWTVAQAVAFLGVSEEDVVNVLPPVMKLPAANGGEGRTRPILRYPARAIRRIRERLMEQAVTG